MCHSLSGNTTFDGNVVFFSGGMYAESNSSVIFSGSMVKQKELGYILWWWNIALENSDISFIGRATFAGNSAAWWEWWNICTGQ